MILNLLMFCIIVLLVILSAFFSGSERVSIA
jgi:Mg2+/Co2+ transporter CorB